MQRYKKLTLADCNLAVFVKPISANITQKRHGFGVPQRVAPNIIT